MNNPYLCTEFIAKNMNRYGLLHFILVTTSFIYAQKGMADTVFSGQVRSEVSKEILAFANIRLEGKKTFMTVSD
ncbi:MAG: hypothetical protein LBJ17_02935, partial [Dysgonamonadaceae bacterium]|nr:hypothetical protein [Dysgonamonadaceae bacterium]